MKSTTPRRSWPDYNAVWRWHFYAGLFCIPFVIVLALTGSVYLFKPQIERWLDRPYDQLRDTQPAASAHAQVLAALTAVPGATLSTYEIPATARAAARVTVLRGADAIRVYVHPKTLAVLKVIPERDRFMNIVKTIHGELLMGNKGSIIVELAACWTLLMIISGLYLWWPRLSGGLAGIVYPRWRRGGRLFWRDLHAVTGVWISALALFVLLTGLPWAKVWGEYFLAVRNLTSTAAAAPDWPIGSPAAAAAAAFAERAKPSGHDGHEAMNMAGAMENSAARIAPNYAALDNIVAAVRPLHLPAPVLIAPPAAGGHWSARSDTQNRPQRVALELTAAGAIVNRKNFADHPLLDRIVGTGVAAHEGQLFGWFNQLLGLLTACGLVLLSVSAVVLWWRRRAQGMLGAPATVQPPRFAPGLALLVIALGVYLPLFGLSLLAVALLEKYLLRRIAPLRAWLGLHGAGA
jgi:uncharacterized iron-regulated membrane protein